MVALLPKERKIIEKGYMEHRPFGVSQKGERVQGISGNSIVGVIEYMMEVVAQKTEARVRAEVGAEEAQRLGQQAAEEALDRMVELLNGAIRDAKFHFTRESLLDEMNWYSYECDKFILEYAKIITGDERFCYNRGMKTIRPHIARLIRPLTLQQIYRLMPRLATKYTGGAEAKVLKTTRNSAIIQMRILKEYDEAFGAYALSCRENVCQGWEGTLTAIPKAVFDLPPAKVQHTTCQARGDECCEWEFVWQNPRPKGNIWLWLGGLASVVLFLFLRALLPGPSGRHLVISVVFALVPLFLSWYTKQLKLARYEKERSESLLLEQRQAADEHYDRLQRTNAELQAANVELKQSISELTTIHRVGTAIASVLDLNSLLDMVLHVVTEELDFDRAMVLLVDEDRRVLTNGRAVGGSQELIAFVKQLEIPLDKEAGLLAQAVLQSEPILVEDVRDLAQDTDRNLVETLQTESFVAVPLKVKTRVIGVVAADNLHPARRRQAQ